MSNTRRINSKAVWSDPLFIGFDKLYYNAQPQLNNSYPPYNVIKVSESEFMIEIAAAGFDEDDVDITVKEHRLTVKASSKQREDTIFIHKGLAERAFERTFTLASTIVVEGAEMKNGIITIKLVNVIPEEKKEKKIPLKTGREFVRDDRKFIRD